MSHTYNCWSGTSCFNYKISTQDDKPDLGTALRELKTTKSPSWILSTLSVSLLVMWYWASSQLPHTSHTNQPQPSLGCLEIWEKNTEKSWEACLLHKQTREGPRNPWDGACFAQGSGFSFSHSRQLTFPHFAAFPQKKLKVVQETRGWWIVGREISHH